MSASASHPDPLGSTAAVAPTAAWVIDAVDEVFRGFLALAARPAEESSFDAAAIAIVHVVGDWRGAVVVSGDLGLVTRCAAAMFELPLDEVGDGEITDAWGEVANLLAGPMVRQLAGRQDLSPPVVVGGSAASVQVRGAEPVCERVFWVEDSRFRVAIVSIATSEPS